MKKILIKLIKLYQRMPISTHDACRYYPTCSEYGIEAISKFGAFKGSVMTIKRIMRCNPFHKGGYDPVGGNDEQTNNHKVWRTNNKKR